MMENHSKHWEKIYETKQPNELSWAQELPKTSLDFIHSFKLNKSAAIIDVGGGDSKLVDHLLEEGFDSITVLDISEKALERVKNRLGEKSSKVKWVVSDVTAYKPTVTYDVWHDRATFHFLTTEPQITNYLETARSVIKGYLIIGTFSDKGPKKCSGLDIKRYNEDQLQLQLSRGFKKIKCITEDHITPSNTSQNFLFCGFKRQ